MSKLVFTKHAEKELRASKDTPDVDSLLNFLDDLEAHSPLITFRSATEALGSPIFKADIREAVSSVWRAVFTVDQSSDPPNFVVLSLQKRGPDDPTDFKDVFNSVITEVGSTSPVFDPNLFGEFISEPVFVPEDEKSRDN